MPRDDIGAQKFVRHFAIPAAIAVGAVVLMARGISMDNDWERAKNHFEVEVEVNSIIYRQDFAFVLIGLYASQLLQLPLPACSGKAFAGRYGAGNTIASSTWGMWNGGTCTMGWQITQM